MNSTTHLAGDGSFRENECTKSLSVQTLSTHKDILNSWFWKCLIQGFKSYGQKKSVFGNFVVFEKNNRVLDVVKNG